MANQDNRSQNQNQNRSQDQSSSGGAGRDQRSGGMAQPGRVQETDKRSSDAHQTSSTKDKDFSSNE